MLKAAFEKAGSNLLFIGLTEADLNMLKEGKPTGIRTSELDTPAPDFVVVHYGPTAEQIEAELEDTVAALMERFSEDRFRRST